MKFEEAKKKSCACIYRITSPEGKSYVGQTKNLGDRIGLYYRFYDSNHRGLLYDTIKKFGFENLDISILTEVKCANTSDLELSLSILEIKYIRELGTLSPNGYNSSVGGEILGIPYDCIYTDLDVNRAYNGNKPILLYDTQGDFLKEYSSICRCAYDLGMKDVEVGKYLNKKSALCGKYIVREKKYNYVPQQICVSDIKVKERIKYKNVIVPKYIEKEVNVGHPCKALLYDENGDFRGEFDSKIKALRSFTNAHAVPFGAYYGGYVIYKKVSDDFPKKIEPYVEAKDYILGDEYKPLSECRKVEESVKAKAKKNYYKRKGWGKHENLINDFSIRQYNDDGFEAIYPSIRDASEATGIPYSNIWACVFGRTRKSRGYYWEKYAKNS